MSLYKILQMVLRGAALILMLFALYFNWEASDLTTTPHFIMSGVFGGFSVVTLGLLMEAGLDKDSDTLVEVGFLVCGIILNMIASILSFIEYYDPTTTLPSSAANKGFLAIVSATMYVIDIACLYC